MKKTMLIIVGVLIAAAGVWWGSRLLLSHIYKSTKEFYTEKLTDSQPAVMQTDCQINGHDCWEVVQGLKETKIILADPHNQYIIPQHLKKMGITIQDGDIIKDGGSLVFTLTNGINIFINQACCGDPQYGFVTITWPDGTQKKFNPQGKLVQ